MANLISAFVNSVNSDSKVLTPAEEFELCTQYILTKDIKIRNLIANHNLRLVMAIANEYSRNQELISEGCIGLVHGIEKFDPTRGYKLSTYVSHWIRAYILNFIVNNAKLVKLGTTQSQRKLFFNLKKERAKLEAQGIDVTSEMLAERLVVSEKDVKEMEVRLKQESSLNETINNGDVINDTTKLDLVVSDTATPDEALAMAEKEVLIKKHFDLFRGSLAPNEKKIFELRILEDKETLRNLGDQFDISHERIRQLEDKIKKRLVRFCEAKNMSALL